jgi:methyltransferase (TIGR00027 family)
MKPGRASQTAVMVCMARAAAHGRWSNVRYDDPTALALLPDEARSRFDRLRAPTAPRGLRARFERAFLDGRARMMVARTVAIDDAVRAVRSPQLVILGAGLDGRAFRMPELRDVVVFEVDHPDTQREKRTRAAALVPMARDVRFVPVDFTRDSLDDALSAAGHDASRPTTWVWEGVVMYLDEAAVESTLAVIEQRSEAKSRLVTLYHAPALILRLVGPMVRRLGEPLRSVFTADAMRALLERHGFTVVEDEDLPSIAARLSSDLVRSTRRLKHTRIVTADRPPSSP